MKITLLVISAMLMFGIYTSQAAPKSTNPIETAIINADKASFPEKKALANATIKARIVKIGGAKFYNDMLSRTDMSAGIDRVGVYYRFGSFKAHCGGLEQWTLLYNYLNDQLSVVLTIDGENFYKTEETVFPEHLL